MGIIEINNRTAYTDTEMDILDRKIINYHRINYIEDIQEAPT